MPPTCQPELRKQTVVIPSVACIMYCVNSLVGWRMVDGGCGKDSRRITAKLRTPCAIHRLFVYFEVVLCWPRTCRRDFLYISCFPFPILYSVETTLPLSLTESKTVFESYVKEIEEDEANHATRERKWVYIKQTRTKRIAYN